MQCYWGHVDVIVGCFDDFDAEAGGFSEQISSPQI